MTSTRRDYRTGAGEGARTPTPSPPRLDLLDDFRSQLEQLTATQRDLMDELRSDGTMNLDAEELPHLRQENTALRKRVEELERQLRRMPAGEEAWEERQVEYEKLLEEKSETIRNLHLKVQELQSQPAPAAPSVDELRDAAVERMKDELAEQRRQLEDDEAALMEQTRTMEMALAKDRAELARLRAELQRQQADLARELEMANRDPDLHERLANLRPRHQEAQAKRTAEEPTLGADQRAASAHKSSGFIRRIFG